MTKTLVPISTPSTATTKPKKPNKSKNKKSDFRLYLIFFLSFILSTSLIFTLLTISSSWSTSSFYGLGTQDWPVPDDPGYRSCTSRRQVGAKNRSCSAHVGCEHVDELKVAPKLAVMTLQEATNCSLIHNSVCNWFARNHHRAMITESDLMDFSGVTLIVTFQGAADDNLETAEILNSFYAPIFAKTVFCAPKWPEHRTTALFLIEYRGSVEEPGDYSYRCVVDVYAQTAMAQSGNQSVLVVGAETVPNLWQLGRDKFKMERSWLMANRHNEYDSENLSPAIDIDKYRTCSFVVPQKGGPRARAPVIDNCDTKINNKTGSTSTGMLDRLRSFYWSLEIRAASSWFWRSIYTGLISASGDRFRVMSTGADIYFISSRHLERVVVVLRLASDSEIDAPFAVASAIRSAVDPTQLSYLDDKTAKSRSPAIAPGNVAGDYRADSLFYRHLKIACLKGALLQTRCVFCSIQSMFSHYSSLYYPFKVSNS